MLKTMSAKYDPYSYAADTADPKPDEPPRNAASETAAVKQLQVSSPQSNTSTTYRSLAEKWLGVAALKYDPGIVDHLGHSNSSLVSALDSKDVNSHNVPLGDLVTVEGSKPAKDVYNEFANPSPAVSSFMEEGRRNHKNHKKQSDAMLIPAQVKPDNSDHSDNSPSSPPGMSL